jgi:hypothetical protein
MFVTRGIECSVFLVNVRYTWHRIPCQGSFPPEFWPEFGFRWIPEQINLALE